MQDQSVTAFCIPLQTIQPQFSLETHRTLFNSTRYSLPRSPPVSMSARPKTYVTPTGAGSGRSVSCRTHKHAQTNVFAHSWNTVQVFQRIRRCQTEPRGKHAQTDVIVRGSFLFTMFNTGEPVIICRRQISQNRDCSMISVFLLPAAKLQSVQGTPGEARKPRSGGPKRRLSARTREWWSRTGSNRRPEACKATALPTELRPQTRPKHEWWAWEDLNFRPHAYQARALTN